MLSRQRTFRERKDKEVRDLQGQVTSLTATVNGLKRENVQLKREMVGLGSQLAHHAIHGQNNSLLKSELSRLEARLVQAQGIIELLRVVLQRQTERMNGVSNVRDSNTCNENVYDC